MAAVQIDKSLFLLLVAYFSVIPDPTPEEARIRDQLLAKLDKIALRTLYSQSKTAPTPEERDAARKKYLDAAGISQGFRWH